MPRIPIPDASKDLKRRALRRTPPSQRVQQHIDVHRRAPVASGSAAMWLGIALAAIPCLVWASLVDYLLGPLALLLVPIGLAAFWWIRRAATSNRAPAASAWRQHRRRRRALRRAKAA